MNERQVIHMTRYHWNDGERSHCLVLGPACPLALPNDGWWEDSTP